MKELKENEFPSMKVEIEKDRIRIVKEIKKLKDQFLKISDEWSNLLNENFMNNSNDYPFDKSFDEIPLEIENWLESIENYEIKD